MEKDKIKRDLFFIVAALTVALLIWGIFCLMNQNGGDTVVVFRDGQILERYSLAQDNIYIIPYGEEYNLLMISGGEAFVSDADCPDGLCMKQRAVSRDGESIICLPHKLVIQVVAKEEGDLDAVTY